MRILAAVEGKRGGWRKGKGTVEVHSRGDGGRAGATKGGLKRKLYSGQCSPRAVRFNYFCSVPTTLPGNLPSAFLPPFSLTTPALPRLVAVGVADASNFIIPSRRTVLPFSHPPRFISTPSIPLVRACNWYVLLIYRVLW